MNRLSQLKTYLSKYSDWTVPDDFFYAYRILFQQYRSPDRDRILKEAVFDMEQLERHSGDIMFHSNQRIPGKIKYGAKYNW